MLVKMSWINLKVWRSNLEESIMRVNNCSCCWKILILINENSYVYLWIWIVHNYAISLDIQSFYILGNEWLILPSFGSVLIPHSVWTTNIRKKLETFLPSTYQTHQNSKHILSWENICIIATLCVNNLICNYHLRQTNRLRSKFHIVSNGIT